MSGTLNINVGILGHVDSGKTSLARVLSTVGSTAAFDKHPQSRERGITLDLGFSSFSVEPPEHLKQYATIQYTLVDCPGHASLIRTIIGGAQIIDIMVLVIDATKGMQTQTAECLVIGEITCDKLLVVINKVDTYPEDTRAAQIDKMTKRLQKTLQQTKFDNVPIVAVAANPGGAEVTEASSANAPIGLEGMISTLKQMTSLPQRSPDGPFIFNVDHCFPIKGQGTVFTGTVLSGSVNVNDTIEIPILKTTKKVKSMQMFRQPVNTIVQGDRAGICVTQFDSALFERGILCSPGALPIATMCIFEVNRVRYFSGSLHHRCRLHTSVGHETIMSTVSFFAGPEGKPFSFSDEYEYVDELKDAKEADPSSKKRIWALLEFDSPVICHLDSLVICSRMDTDIHANTCRLAFYGRIAYLDTDPNFASITLSNLKIFKLKRREGVVDRIHDEQTIIARDLFQKETSLENFVGLKVSLSTGEKGVIEGPFGQTGKVRVRFSSGLQPTTLAVLNAQGKGKKGKGKDKGGKGADKGAAAAEAADDADSSTTTEAGAGSNEVKVILEFKRFVFDEKKVMRQ